jgi:hypothetical protein
MLIKVAVFNQSKTLNDMILSYPIGHKKLSPRIHYITPVPSEMTMMQLYYKRPSATSTGIGH